MRVNSKNEINLNFELEINFYKFYQRYFFFDSGKIGIPPPAITVNGIENEVTYWLESKMVLAIC